MKISFVSFPLEKNLKAQNELIEKYGNCSPEEADFIVALGGDGFILKSLHDYLKIEKPIFGMNFGSVGFLMNEYRLEDLTEVRMEELVCDGVIVSTSAGSTGYNYSASGPIIPLGSNVMALTAVSAYSPRHWRGGLLKDTAKIKIVNNNPSKRPIVAHADHIEAKDVTSVEIEMSEGLEIPLLFDNNHKIEERVYKEMFKS